MKNNSLIFDPTLSAEELRGFSRTVAEIEWLTITLVLLYQVVFSPSPEASSNLALGTLLFAGFVLSFHYFNFYKTETNWKIAIETWVMIAYITWVLMQTGGLDSPLVNLYLLVIITTALTLGKGATMLQIVLIAACYLWLTESSSGESAALYFAGLAARFAPMVLVAYITTMLASDIRIALVRIKMLSEKDELTGVLNMRAFTSVAQRLSRQSARYNHPYAILMVDSDSLKMVNDQHGHQAGNRLLQLLVQAIQAHLRDTDILARYGGDEFIVMLPETTAAGAETVATRIRQRVEAAVLTTRERPVNSTVSIGVAAFPEHGSDLESITERADQALYASKTAGKNLVTVAGGRSFGAAIA